MITKRTLIALPLVLLFVAGFFLDGTRASAQQATPADARTTAPTPTPTIEEEKDVITVDTETVNVLFTAQDKNRRLLLGLKPEDIRVYENGQLQQVSAFSKQIDLPLSLAILIDTSLSQERTLAGRKGGRHILFGICRQAQQRRGIDQSRLPANRHSSRA